MRPRTQPEVRSAAETWLAWPDRGPWTVFGHLRLVCSGLGQLWEETPRDLGPLLLPCPSLTPVIPLTCTPGLHVLRPPYSQVSMFLGAEGEGNVASCRRLSRALSLRDQLGNSAQQPVIQEGLASTPGADRFSECLIPCAGMRRDLMYFFFFFNLHKCFVS